MGHAVFHSLPMPSLLCVIGADIAKEFRIFQDLIFPVVVRLDLRCPHEVFWSDSSSKGYALHAARFSPDVVASLAAPRERWRSTAPDKRRPDGTFTSGWLADHSGLFEDTRGGELGTASGGGMWGPRPRALRDRPAYS